ncbi:redoxin family protein [Candidatus Saganbacteria bacterium]|nr:redoxin family protein [Candidatus Saganbacteria bacterium]
MNRFIFALFLSVLVLAPAFSAQPAKEITSPDGFINTKPVSLADLKGKKVVLIDFWTYSCINCQRTIPYLNAWYEKYKDHGFTILGVHTPEFDFEKKMENVQAAVDKFGIKYPVILDNDHSTWNSYGNQYWPRKALVDMKGEIVYRHIGEGNYEETEKAIQQALKDLKAPVPGGMVKPPAAIEVDFSKIETPEIYLGSRRSAPGQVRMVGRWDTQGEYAENKSADARIVLRYRAKNVYFVASAKEKLTVKVLRDGRPFGSIAVKDETLYQLILDPSGYGEHTLEIIIPRPGLRVFTFTFG